LFSYFYYITRSLFRKAKIRDRIPLNMKLQVLSENLQETEKIASFFVKYIIDCPARGRKKGLVISLEGDLGAGKTEFVKGIGKALQVKENIFSPTYLLMKSFPLQNSCFQFLWHLDCYRLEKEEEAKVLDLEELFSDPANLIFVEWGDKIKNLLPSSCWTIHFLIKKENTRLIIFEIP